MPCTHEHLRTFDELANRRHNYNYEPKMEY